MFCREWEGLESVGLQLGKVSPFLGKMIPTLFAYMYEHAKIISPSKENVIAYYQLVILLMLELSRPCANEVLSFLSKLQNLASNKESQLSPQQCISLHATVAGVLHTLVQIMSSPILKGTVSVVIQRRRESSIRMLPDGLFREHVSLLEEEAVTEDLSLGPDLLFMLKDEAAMMRTSESGASLKKPFG